MKWRNFVLVVLGTVLSESAAAGGAEPAPAQLVWADFDGDGLQDVYVVRPEGEDALYRNVGDGTFEDVTANALACVSCASLEVAWRDVDLDRRQDLLRLTVAGNVELLRNGGDGVFEDVTLIAGLERVSGASSARWLDYDADGRADLELSTESAPQVYHNLGDFLFEAVTFGAAGGTLTEETSPVQAIPGALDAESGLTTDGANVPADEPEHGPRRRGGDPVAALGGALVAKVHPDPLVPGAPPVDPLEPRGDEVSLLIPPFTNRCAWSVKDTSGGDCVLTSTIPTLGKLYPISTNLFVSTGGSVGIGTTTPAMKLDVAGTARVTDTLTLAPSGDVALDVSTGSIYKGGSLFVHSKGGLGNTAIGRDALTSVTSGTFNTASGYRALLSNTTGYENTASGTRALYANTTGFRNTASGTYALRSNTAGARNTASGADALRYNTTGFQNTASGAYALRSNTTGFQNTASGAYALRSNTTGNANTASGVAALRSNTTGARNTASGVAALSFNTTGARNTASGYLALTYNTTGYRNTANGADALGSNTIGFQNTASGAYALRSNTTGFSNTASGADALRSNTTGNRNTASGTYALRYNTTGSYNTASGAFALRSNTTGYENTASGSGALVYNTTGYDNTASGFTALRSNTAGARNTASGADALRYNTTGFQNTASGAYALRSNTTGNDNTASGADALRSNTTGARNTASGTDALRSNTTGYSNTASGFTALYDNTTGTRNTASGAYALGSNTTGNRNTASGFSALYYNTTGSYNAASGHKALYNNTGNDNTASGTYALYSNTTGSRNIAIGKNAGYSLTTGSDNIVIGNLGVAAESATIRIGSAQTRTFIDAIRGVTTANANAIPVLIDSAGQLGTVSSSRRFKEDIRDMGDATERLLELRPVLFRYKQEQVLPNGQEVPPEYGLIAEEVAEIFPDLVVYDDEGLPFTVKYHLLSSMLLNELKKQAHELEEQRSELTRLSGIEARLDAIEARATVTSLVSAAPADSR